LHVILVNTVLVTADNNLIDHIGMKRILPPPPVAVRVVTVRVVTVVAIVYSKNNLQAGNLNSTRKVSIGRFTKID
jgi:hypothetical protein